MKLKVIFLLATASWLLPAQISVGIRIGAPPPVRIERNNIRRPGPEYVWIDGYWYPDHNKYKWHKGYWTRPPFAGAHWAPARHERDMFYEGYWQRDNDRFEHDHRWDRERDRRDNDRRR